MQPYLEQLHSLKVFAKLRFPSAYQRCLNYFHDRPQKRVQAVKKLLQALCLSCFFLDL
ncbi:hypothetical protein LNTAR_11476 [Lentisphaera araneosa HTCC2155]|uniref:Uncharacterized protein n=1 Tax=Lentisphaera araneosa HTCC2155 TaxID=313628 RepID=A6DJ98_9BACT|nr:hypothetical protein LNTAR_11476 [Lentisphaera araneosa HTCC2155]